MGFKVSLKDIENIEVINVLASSYGKECKKLELKYCLKTGKSLYIVASNNIKILETSFLKQAIKRFNEL